MEAAVPGQEFIQLGWKSRNDPRKPHFQSFVQGPHWDARFFWRGLGDFYVAPRVDPPGGRRGDRSGLWRGLADIDHQKHASA